MAGSYLGMFDDRSFDGGPHSARRRNVRDFLVLVYQRGSFPMPLQTSPRYTLRKVTPIITCHGTWQIMGTGRNDVRLGRDKLLTRLNDVGVAGWGSRLNNDQCVRCD